MRDNDFDTIRKAFAYSEKCKSYSIDNEDNYKEIVYGPAYKDFTPRTVKGISEGKIDSALCLIVKEGLFPH